MDASFSKRRGWLVKKADELAVLCDAQVGLIIFSSTGDMFEYCSPHSSMCQIIDRFKNASGTRIQEYDDKQQIYCEMTKMKNENDKLQATMRHLTGEDLTTLTKADLKQLELQLEASMYQVRSREIQLLQAELEDLSRKRGKEVEKQEEDEQSRDVEVIDAPPLLQLLPHRLQPFEPNLQDPNLHHHACGSGCPADDGTML